MGRTQGEKESLVHIFLYLEHFAQIGDNIRKTGKFQNRMILTLAYLTDLTCVRTCGEIQYLSYHGTLFALTEGVNISTIPTLAYCLHGEFLWDHGVTIDTDHWVGRNTHGLFES